MSFEIKSEEKIWYEYQTEVFDKLPPMKNPLKPKPIPMKYMKRISKRWVSVQSVLAYLEKKEADAKVIDNTGNAYIYRKLAEEVAQAMFKSLNANQPIKKEE